MSTTSINLNSGKSNRNSFHKRQVKLKFSNRRAEVIAWILFFGIGVAYFITTLIIAAV
ncbi:MAG: hypothetical protein IPO32_09895 [Crocinitomicaceae bacterium]|nr:hypothetical protein [Crocinitomicaceae bacterium]MBK9591794.1 hypothetical protein [Crocinitomicaceae bacterium]